MTSRRILFLAAPALFASLVLLSAAFAHSGAQASVGIWAGRAADTQPGDVPIIAIEARAEASQGGYVLESTAGGLRAPVQPRQPFDPTTLDLAWTAPLRNTLHSLPVVDGDAVYMSEGFLDHTALYAFPVSCGAAGAICERAWRGRTGATPSAPVVADGVVYVGSGAYLNVPQLLAFPVSCRTDGRWCDPLWQGFGNGPLIVTDGAVYSAANSHQEGESFVGPRLYAYDVSCGADGNICEPRWYADLESDVSAITSEAGMIFATTGHPEGSILYAYPAACDVVDGRCEPAWTVVVRGYFGELIAADGFVYVFG